MKVSRTALLLMGLLSMASIMSAVPISCRSYTTTPTGSICIDGGTIFSNFQEVQPNGGRHDEGLDDSRYGSCLAAKTCGFGTEGVPVVYVSEDFDVRKPDARRFGDISEDFTVPEPMTLSLLGIGLVCLGLLRRKITKG